MSPQGEAVLQDQKARGGTELDQRKRMVSQRGREHLK